MKKEILTGLVTFVFVFIFLIISMSAVLSVLSQAGIGVPVIINFSDNTSDTSNRNIVNITEIHLIEVIGFVPKTFKLGDVQFNVKVLNKDNITKNNLIAFVSGNGFSTYDIIPIESLAPDEKDYIFISGNFKEKGNITLIIRIDKEIFYQNISVVGENEIDLTEQQKAEEERKNILNNLSGQFYDLKQKYYQFESDYFDKKGNDYDVSIVNLDDLKKYIKEIEFDIINEDIKDVKAKLKLSYEAYEEQKKKLDSTKQKSIWLRMKDYAFIFSTIAGALLTFFALSELLKRKSQHIVRIVKKPIKLKRKRKKKEEL